ncbi:MAG: hypothetical protein OEM32_05990 [Acidimicrobiia bacterium]|nr:hypothetical protein [Acidimicrobiia bacterium]
MKVVPPLIPWAARGAGAIGIVTAVLYLALVIGAGDDANFAIALGWLVLMGGAGILAWFADRAPARSGRRMMWAAFTLFFVIGVVSIYTIGILYLIASVLSIFSLSRRSQDLATDLSANRDGT